MAEVTANNGKKIFFFFICVPFPLYQVSTWLFGFELAGSMVEWKPFLIGFFLIGFIWVLVDLWTSRLDKDEKGWWTLSIVLLSFVLLPYYWYYRFNLERMKFETGKDLKNASDLES